MNTILGALQMLAGLIGKKIIFLGKTSSSFLGKTSALSRYGFWYVGDVFDTADIAYGIARNGIVEKEESELVVNILKKLISDKKIIFYDIGANTGYYGILAAHHAKEKIRVFSFEPVSEYCGCIKESARLNRVEDKIKIFNTALGEEVGSKKLYFAGSGSTLYPDFLDNSKVPQRAVTVQTLDGVAKEHGIPAPDFIKIDVEGYELPVLRGGYETIKSSLPILFIEIVYSLKVLGRKFINKDYQATFDFLRELGYRTFCIERGRLLEVDTGHRNDGVRMFLFLHFNRHEPIIKALPT